MEEQNNIVEPKKKSPIGLIILIVILMIGCLVGGYFLNESGVFDKFQKDTMNEKSKREEKEKSEEEIKEELVEVDSDLIKKLDRNITTAGAPYYGGFYELFTDKKMTANDLSDDAKGSVIQLRLYDKINTGGYTQWEGTTYTKAEVEKLAKEVFGSAVKYNPKTIGRCPTIIYDETTEIYTVGPSACGGTVGPYHNRHKVIKAIKKGNELVLSIRVVFGDGSKFYSDYANANVISEDKDENGNPTINDFSKGTLYKAVFKLEDDNYGLSYVEPVKD